MITINIKPLSVNGAWKGKKYKTKEYTMYIRDCLLLLPKIDVPDGKLSVKYVFGMSKMTDIDNPIKPLQDILQKAYGFDDNRIYHLVAEKKVVKKGEEFISFEINEYVF